VTNDHHCPACGSTLDRREGPSGVSYQCIDDECHQTYGPEEIEEPAPPPPPPTAAEQQAAFQQHMAFNVEAIRSGFFGTAQDMAKMMQKNGVAHADAILMTAAIEFAVQLWVQVALRAGGITPKKMRETLEKEVRFYYRKHLTAEQEGAQPATRQ
jgi:hypothetical protein